MAQIAPVADQAPTCPSADGSTQLTGFVVAGVIYAPTKREARRRLEHSLELDVGEITGRIPRASARRARALSEEAPLTQAQIEDATLSAMRAEQTCANCGADDKPLAATVGRGDCCGPCVKANRDRDPEFAQVTVEAKP